ncbi:MAG: 50S ribosomal protein L11 methyltransferase [Chloroflexi bacterium]|nr:50S ribosomal protein L11 methyltransferase [Chloroflexota bacterium]
MTLLEISVTVDGEAAEAVHELFARYGEGGAVIEQIQLQDEMSSHGNANAPFTVKAYLLLVAEDTAERRQRIEEGLWHLGRIYPIPAPQFRELLEEDWSEAWKRHYNITRLGERTVVVPAWLAYEPQPGEAVIRLDPGMAFGTGTHPSTALCLVAMERLVKPGMRVLDVGAGSGILSIGAVKLGAATVVGLEIDRLAVRIGQENLVLSEVTEQAQIIPGSLQDLPQEMGKFDLVLMNILAHIIVELAPQLHPFVAAGSHIIVSGIIFDREESVRQCFAQEGITVLQRQQLGDWITLAGEFTR